MTSFISRGPLNPERHDNIIVHRKELDDILKHIKTGTDQEGYVALRAPRQTGKTTLLYQVRHHLHGKGYGVAYIDLQGLNNLKEEAFYQKICTDIHGDLSKIIDKDTKAAKQIKIMPPGKVKDQSDFSAYLIWLSACTCIPEVKGLVIILDEIGGIPEDISTFSSCLRAFLSAGREKTSEQDYLYRRVIFIFAGALDLLQFTREDNSPLSNVCKLYSLNDFSQEQGAELLNRKLSDRLSSEMIKALADSVYEWTSGHPYLTMRLYDLIQDNVDLKNISVNQIPGIGRQLVEEYILYGDDTNLNHVSKHLRKNKEFCNQVFTILDEKRRTVIDEQDLFTIGIIKKSSDFYLMIRNKIYQEWLEKKVRPNVKKQN